MEGNTHPFLDVGDIPHGDIATEQGEGGVDGDGRCGMRWDGVVW